MVLLRQAPEPISPECRTGRSMASYGSSIPSDLGTPTSPYAPSVAEVQRLNALVLHKKFLEDEHKELQRLVEAARELHNQASVARSRPTTPQARQREEEALYAKGAAIRRRAALCGSRPVSAASAGAKSCRSYGSYAMSASGRRIRPRPESATNRAATRDSSAPRLPGLLPAGESADPFRDGGSSPSAGSHRPSSLPVRVELDRGNGMISLGMKVKTAPGNVLEVTTVKDEGVVAQWNKANPSMAICEGQTIVEVNGVSGAAEKLYEQLKAQTLCLTLVGSGMPRAAVAVTAGACPLSP
mmetsp:Transcript_84605/g.218025  ORF Transcript_84605/g.218025 Transcript_84605/m.218025 type:complete len:299 (+) Transcript_84605:36-932(+)